MALPAKNENKEIFDYNLVVTQISISPLTKLIPINSTPKYMASPKAAAVAIHALMLPNKPNHGFERTVSPIMHVKIL